MSHLNIHTVVNARYHVFDSSGQLPFSIVFGLCRRSSSDTDPRPLLLFAGESVLDVPYALKHALLTLHEEKGNGEQVKLNASGLDFGDDEGNAGGPTPKYVELSSPVDRTGGKWNAFVTYEYRIEAGSKLARIFEPGRKYVIRVAGETEMGIKWWAYGHRHELLGDDGEPVRCSETARALQSKPSNGNARFSFRGPLPWPPKIQLQMCRGPASEPGGSPTLEICVSNTTCDEQAISIQTRGEQHFLIAWKPMQFVEDGTNDATPRIIDRNTDSPTSSLRIIDANTKAIVRNSFQPTGIRALTSGNIDHRPKSDALVTLSPGQPIEKQIDVGQMVAKLPDGDYIVQMEARACWWSTGRREEIIDEGDGRVQKALYRTKIPPLLLECEDEVRLRVEGGRWVE